MSAARCERDLKTFESRNKRLERQAAKVGTTSENAELWERIEDEMSANKELSKTLIKNIKKLQGAEGKALASAFKREYQRFQAILAKITQKSGGEVGDDMESMGGTPHGGQMTQDQVRLDEVKKAENMEMKATKVRQLNQDVRDLANMFHDVNALVGEQQETVDRITVNVETAKENTGNATGELQQAAGYLDASRRRWLCMFIVLLLVAAVVGVVIWATTSNNNN